jgi:hypothetical protein
MMGDMMFSQVFVEFYDVEFYYNFVGICAAAIAVWPSATKNNELNPVAYDPCAYPFETPAAAYRIILCNSTMLY